jgi:hypothetical protein
MNDHAGIPRQLQETQTYRNSAGQVRAVTMQADDGAAFTVSLPRQAVSGADPEVWADPEAYGLERYYCPGHGGGACEYGAHDEIRYPGALPGIDPDPEADSDRPGQGRHGYAAVG